jgi:hypothetical protein
MGKVHGEHFDLVGPLLARDQIGKRRVELQPTQLALDLHLPDARHAEQNDIRPILTQGQGLS